MNEDARTLMRQLLEEGNPRESVHNELISQGYDTDGFEEEYAAIANELNIEVGSTSAKQVSADPTQAALGVGPDAYRVYKRPLGVGRMLRDALKLLAGVLVIAAAFILLSGYGTQLKNALFGESSGEFSDMTAQDLSHQANMRAFQASAETYKRRLLDYSGMCSDIGINREVYRCNENTESYAIEVPLSTGEYYCVDSSGFAGVTENSVRGSTSCAQ